MRRTVTRLHVSPISRAEKIFGRNRDATLSVGAVTTKLPGMSSGKVSYTNGTMAAADYSKWSNDQLIQRVTELEQRLSEQTNAYVDLHRLAG